MLNCDTTRLIVPVYIVCFQIIIIKMNVLLFKRAVYNKTTALGNKKEQNDNTLLMT